MNRLVLRSLSTKIQRTPEQIAAGLQKAEKFKKFIKSSIMPTSMSHALPSGDELHVPQNPAETAVFSGMPREHANRTVVIAQRMNRSVQSGDKGSHHWQITWKHAERWTNPLMGWTSSADPMHSVKLNFNTREEAITFAQNNGWKYEVLREVDSRTVPAGNYLYKHNFLEKRTLAILKKEGPSTKLFENPKYGNSNWFMPLTYHGDKEVEQHGPRN